MKKNESISSYIYFSFFLLSFFFFNKKKCLLKTEKNICIKSEIHPAEALEMQSAPTIVTNRIIGHLRIAALFNRI